MTMEPKSASNSRPSKRRTSAARWQAFSSRRSRRSAFRRSRSPRPRSSTLVESPKPSKHSERWSLTSSSRCSMRRRPGGSSSRRSSPPTAFKRYALARSDLARVAEQVTRNIDFGGTAQSLGVVAKIGATFAEQQSALFRSLAPALEAMRANFYPANLRAIEALGFRGRRDGRPGRWHPALRRAAPRHRRGADPSREHEQASGDPRSAMEGDLCRLPSHRHGLDRGVCRSSDPFRAGGPGRVGRRPPRGRTGSCRVSCRRSSPSTSATNATSSRPARRTPPPTPTTNSRSASSSPSARYGGPTSNSSSPAATWCR